MLSNAIKNSLKVIATLTIATILISSKSAVAAELPDIVSSARPAAADALTSLTYYKFQNTPLSNDEIHWLVFYRNELAIDVKAVKHSWNVGNFQQCAWTRVEKAAAIDFSQSQCESAIFSVQQAVPILIQMSLIHYGISEQRSFVMTQVILSVGGVTPPLVPNPVPSPSPVVDVFNPAICSGPEITAQEMISYFAPGTVYVNPPIKAVQYDRVRVCNVATGCTAWITKERDLPNTGRDFTLNFHVSVDAKVGYSISTVESYYFQVPNAGSAGLEGTYWAKLNKPFVTNKCLYLKNYTATEKSNNGSFAESEFVIYGLQSPRK